MPRLNTLIIVIFGIRTVMNEKIITPCIGVCSIDDNTGYCKGCLRTLEEIANWIQYTDEERLEVVEKLKKRREELKQFTFS